jgi:hypothetical protein
MASHVVIGYEGSEASEDAVAFGSSSRERS